MYIPIEKKELNLSMTDHLNLYNHALTIIQRKGCSLFLWPTSEESTGYVLYAMKEKRIFTATDPLRLLGMISIWEIHGDA